MAANTDSRASLGPHWGQPLITLVLATAPSRWPPTSPPPYGDGVAASSTRKRNRQGNSVEVRTPAAWLHGAVQMPNWRRLSPCTHRPPPRPHVTGGRGAAK